MQGSYTANWLVIKPSPSLCSMDKAYRVSVSFSCFIYRLLIDCLPFYRWSLIWKKERPRVVVVITTRKHLPAVTMCFSYFCSVCISLRRICWCMQICIDFYHFRFWGLSRSPSYIFSWIFVESKWFEKSLVTFSDVILLNKYYWLGLVMYCDMMCSRYEKLQEVGCVRVLVEWHTVERVCGN